MDREYRENIELVSLDILCSRELALDGYTRTVQITDRQGNTATYWVNDEGGFSSCRSEARIYDGDYWDWRLKEDPADDYTI